MRSELERSGSSAEGGVAAGSCSSSAVEVMRAGAGPRGYDNTHHMNFKNICKCQKYENSILKFHFSNILQHFKT
jgi:hypothetical protein